MDKRNFRKYLRSNLTPAEAALWKLLKAKQFNGKKFRRQHPIENYIVDFYCPEYSLVIELDGEVHNDINSVYADEQRDIRLAELGYTVLRFENKEVFEATDNVLNAIESYFNK